jgi:hypothetical protein
MVTSATMLGLHGLRFEAGDPWFFPRQGGLQCIGAHLASAGSFIQAL